MFSTKRKDIFVLTILSFFALLSLVWIREIDSSEARNLISAREILQNSNWWTPTLNGHFYFENPPLPVWITAFVMMITHSHSEVILRLPNMLCCIFTVLFLYRSMIRIKKDRLFAFLCSFVLLSTFMFIKLGAENTWDIYTYSFAFCASLAFYVYIKYGEKKNLYRMGILLVLSFLSKGPVGFYSLFIPFLQIFYSIFKVFYERDFAKHPNIYEFPKISMIWKSIPSQLSKENKKFIYKVVKEGARAREYEDALQFLLKAQELGREDSWIYAEIGQCLGRLDKYEEGIENLKKALEILEKDKVYDNRNEKIFINSEIGWLYGKIEGSDPNEALHYLYAARDLGATNFQAFRKVFIPNIKAGIITSTIFTLIPALGSYAVPKLVGGTNSLMLGNVIAQHLTVTRNWPLASTISGALIVLTSIVVWLFSKYEEKENKVGENNV